MELKAEEEKLLTGYLLGDLSEDEKAQIEARFFADDDYYESLLVAEDELIYNYLRGGLSSRESQQFEAQIAASPKRREKVRFIKALMAEAAQATVPQSAKAGAEEEGESWWKMALAILTGRNAALQLAMAAAVLFLGIAGFWLWTETRQLSAQLQLAQAQQRDYEQRDQNAKHKADTLQTQNQELAKQLQQEQATREQLLKAQEQLKTQLGNARGQAALIIPFTLEPGISRSESDDPKPISVPRLASRIQLTLALGSDDGSGMYRAELRSRGGTLIWSQDRLSSKQMPWGKAVVLPLPAGVFRNSEYDLTLKRTVSKGEFEDVGYYYFKVVKQ